MIHQKRTIGILLCLCLGLTFNVILNGKSVTSYSSSYISVEYPNLADAYTTQYGSTIPIQWTFITTSGSEITSNQALALINETLVDISNPTIPITLVSLTSTIPINNTYNYVVPTTFTIGKFVNLKITFWYYYSDDSGVHITPVLSTVFYSFTWGGITAPTDTSTETTTPTTVDSTTILIVILIIAGIGVGIYFYTKSRIPSRCYQPSLNNPYQKNMISDPTCRQKYIDKYHRTPESDPSLNQTQPQRPMYAQPQQSQPRSLPPPPSQNQTYPSSPRKQTFYDANGNPIPQ